MLNFILVVISSCLIWFNIQTMWNWFVAPFGVMSITYLHAGAILLMIKYLQYYDTSFEEAKLKRNDSSMTEDLVYKIIFGLIGLLLAWLIHISM